TSNCRMLYKRYGVPKVRMPNFFILLNHFVLFSSTKHLVCIHGEMHKMIQQNEEIWHAQFGDAIPFIKHPTIRSAEACYIATSQAIQLARRSNARLHIYHLTSGIETALFENHLPVHEKKITTEVCVQHLWFSDSDYERLGPLIKWNPSIKTPDDREALWVALLDDRIDLITSDHAPHTLAEKQRPYLQSLSGAPIIQHSLYLMMECYFQGKIPLEKIVEKMCHNPALVYGIEKRGFLREGYFADLIILNPAAPWTVAKSNLYSKCGWSPIEGQRFSSSITHTFVNGVCVYKNGKFTGLKAGMPLLRNDTCSYFFHFLISIVIRLNLHLYYSYSNRTF
ncbi:MAG: amidohydrolase family protein, partial [Ferruginibacter sp.]